MSSKVLDLTTMGHALTELSNSFLGDCEWDGVNEQQQRFLSWYAEHRDEITKLSDLEALASTDYQVLNRFLQTHGFGPMFQPFDPDDGIGVAAILDMLVEWIKEGTPTTINRHEAQYPAFRLDSVGVNVYTVPGYELPLVRLETQTGHHLWLMKASEPESGLDLNAQAQHLLDSEHRPSWQWSGVVVPMMELDVKPDVSWMLGVKTLSSRGPYEVTQVFQQFKLRANAKGARVKVVTGMVMRMTSSMTPPTPPYVLDDPFIGFFTQPGNETLPLAVFWADTDVWQNPGGTLEEL